jgi:hypothetical protein
MRDFLLNAKEGKIEVWEFPDVVFTGSPEEVAHFLAEKGATEWLCSSSMDFGTEYGFDQDNVRYLLSKACEALHLPTYSGMRAVMTTHRFDPDRG